MSDINHLKCHTFRELLHKIICIYGEFINHENSLIKCKVCLEQSEQFNSVKKHLFLIVREHLTTELEAPSFFVNTIQQLNYKRPSSNQNTLNDNNLKLENEEFSTCNFDNDFDTDSNPCELVKEINPLEKKKSCPICFKLFYSERHLAEHLTQHDKNKEHYLEQSLSRKGLSHPVSADSFSELKQKISFECGYCGDVCFERSKLRSHIKIHITHKSKLIGNKIKKISTSTDGNPYDKTCRICQKMFSSSKGLKKHMKIHEICTQPTKKKSKETPYACEICKRFFRKPILLDRHKEFRNSVNIQCETCSGKFCTSADLYNHQKFVHKVNTIFQCKYCEKKFPNFLLLFRHHKVKHPTFMEPTKPILCEMCGLSMADSRDLDRHCKIQCKMMPYKCETCNKKFRFQSQLDEHHRIHIPMSQLKDFFACDECSKRFRTKLTLERHKRIHTGQITEMFCEVCRRRFINAKNLKSHMEKHAREAPRPFKCELCGQLLKIRKEYNMHMKTRHNILTAGKEKVE